MQDGHPWPQLSPVCATVQWPPPLFIPTWSVASQSSSDHLGTQLVNNSDNIASTSCLKGRHSSLPRHVKGWTGKHIGGLSVWQPLDWAKISLQNMSNFKSQLDGIWPIGNGKVQVSVYQRLLPLTQNTLKPYDPLHCCAATLKDLTSIFYHLQCGLSITQATGFCTVVLWCCEWLTVVGRKGPRSTDHSCD